MRKYLFMITTLVLAIFAVLVSDTMALYTKSFDYDLTLLLTKDPNRPIIEGDFLKYEFSDDKTCDYNQINDYTIDPNARKCAQGSVVFDPEHFTMTISQDAGAMKNYPIEYGNSSYIVNARVTNITPSTLANFGLFFNGSFSSIQYGKVSIGYSLKFKENGDLVINEEGFKNNISDDHKDDSMHTTSEPSTLVRDRIVATHEQVVQVLGDQITPDGIVLSDHIDMQVRVNVINDSIYAYVYLNGHLMNDSAIAVGLDRRKIHAGGLLANNMIGFSSYGKDKSVTVRKLYMETWDGVTTEYGKYPMEDQEYN